VHSEMPKVTDGILHGFQLWINLPKKDKMCKPRCARLGGGGGRAGRQAASGSGMNRNRMGGRPCGLLHGADAGNGEWVVPRS
jgi:hypothetical protein